MCIRDSHGPRPSRTRWGRLLTESTRFDWGGALNRDGARRFGALVRALAAYKAEFGDVAVARGFRVPNADPRPPARTSHLRPDFDPRVVERSVPVSSAVLRALDESHRFVQT